MKIERKDLFDFIVTLDEQEFNDIKVVSDFDKIPVEDVLSDVVQYGFDVLRNGKSEKE